MSTFDIELEKNADGEYVMPTGGIANFYFTDVDEHDDDDVDDMIYGPRGGLHDLKPVAEKLASFGRYGDDTVAHVETGEFVVPVDIQKENPELISKLKEAIASYGVSPDRYVVGSEYVSINPVTGQPEFFFKKLFRKVKKAVKKVVSGVKKVVKKVVKAIKPVVGTIATVALTPFVGPIAAGAIGGGIQGLADGKGLKGAIKGAVTGGLTAGVMSGAAGAFKSIGNPKISLGQGFMSGVRDGFGKTAFMNNVAEKIMPSVPTSAERLMMIKNPGLTWQQAEGVTDYMKNAKIDINDAIKKEGLNPSAARTAEEIAQQNALKEVGYTGTSAMSGTELRNALVSDPAAQAKFKELTELNATFDPSMQMTQEEIMQAALKQTGTSATSGFFNFKNADGSMNLGKMATAASIALPVAGAALGAFDPVPADEIDDPYGEGPTDEQISESSPGVPDDEVYVGTPMGDSVGQPGGGGDNGGYTPLVGGTGVGQPGTQPTFVDYGGTTVGPNTAYNPDLMGSFNNNIYYPSQYQTIPGYNPQITGMSPAPFYGYDEYGRPIYSYYGTPDVREANFVPQGDGGGSAMPPEQQFVSAQDVQMAAVGGPMTRDNFPRRTGMIQGPGTETSDDIPAMLSDGEFVMTARAVRGAGGGDRQQGFRKMYDIMRAFEGGAVA